MDIGEWIILLHWCLNMRWSLRNNGEYIAKNDTSYEYKRMDNTAPLVPKHEMIT
jgi:hypothetical protein